jgi:hypothetical protein
MNICLFTWYIVTLTETFTGHRIYVVFLLTKYVQNDFHSDKYLTSEPWDVQSNKGTSACSVVRF